MAERFGGQHMLDGWRRASRDGKAAVAHEPTRRRQRRGVAEREQRVANLEREAAVHLIELKDVLGILALPSEGAGREREQARIAATERERAARVDRQEPTGGGLPQ